LSPCYATSTAGSDSLSVPGHWGLSDGISKELVTDQEIGVVYANESSSAAAGHIGVVRDGQSEGGSSEQKLTSGAAAGTPEVQQHTQGMTADGFRVVDEDLAGNGGGIHDDGRECTNAGMFSAPYMCFIWEHYEASFLRCLFVVFLDCQPGDLTEACMHAKRRGP
jgi:hypothetical protein